MTKIEEYCNLYKKMMIKINFKKKVKTKMNELTQFTPKELTSEFGYTERMIA